MSGRGVGFSGAARRRLGSSLGSLSFKLGIPCADGRAAGRWVAIIETVLMRSLIVGGLLVVDDDDG